MNVFELHRGYRKIGINYGLPVFYIDVGFGVGYKPEEIIGKLGGLGLKVGSWVVIRNNALKEKGIGILVSGLKYVKTRVELEEDGTNATPGWFPSVDRWIVDYRKDAVFNYGALRPRQDMLIYGGSDIEEFIREAQKFQALKVIFTDDVDKIWDRVKDLDIRVYRKEGERVC